MGEANPCGRNEVGAVSGTTTYKKLPRYHSTRPKKTRVAGAELPRARAWLISTRKPARARSLIGGARPWMPDRKPDITNQVMPSLKESDELEIGS
jgi:hypothetical protein